MLYFLFIFDRNPKELTTLKSTVKRRHASQSTDRREEELVVERPQEEEEEVPEEVEAVPEAAGHQISCRLPCLLSASSWLSESHPASGHLYRES
jgi:hypothetical protein